MRNKLTQNYVNQFSKGIHVSLEELIALRKQMIPPTTQSKKKSLSVFAGQKITKIRGRGIEFDAVREYHPGDDIRRMAWRVTARSLKPYVKVYHEERERPVWVAVDLSPSLYFGTRCMFKSVRCIKQAAMIGWSYFNVAGSRNSRGDGGHERIGAFIATPNKILSFSPKAKERDFILILKSLADCANRPFAFTEKNCLHALLLTMQKQIRAGHSVFIFSDFLQFNDDTKKLISLLSQRAQVNLMFVYDPFEATPPPAGDYLLTDGQHVVPFNIGNTQNRAHYLQQFQRKQNDLIDFTRKSNITLQVLCTDQAQG